MTGQNESLLNETQLATLQKTLHLGSSDASEALAKWVNKHAVVEVDALNQLSMENATTLLGEGEEPICFCSMEVRGLIAGEMILAFDDPSGFALTEMLLGQPAGSITTWDELAVSAVMETANIVCCAYLNSLSTNLLSNQPSSDPRSSELIPAPPVFRREYPASMLQFAVMDQAIARDQVLTCQTRFQIDNAPVQWTLLFVPDADSMSRLVQLLVNERWTQ